MYHHILVPLDGSPTSRRGLSEAIKLAGLTGAKLKLLHYIDPFSYVGGFESPSVYLVDLLPVLRESGKAILKEGQALAAAQQITADTVLIDDANDRLCDRVIAQAQDWPADLIVMGTHGRRGVNRVFLGSDAEQILRLAPVPVLLVRGVDDEADGAGDRAV
ncbi:universal stress protein [Polaromonas sp.]|uniref:universal stress protein n=1 Tax=Polaromonas sp. TaxID=1869339 RepID=UPI00286BEA46|nr:universal stress protein [Polaromonas sp.]